VSKTEDHVIGLRGYRTIKEVHEHAVQVWNDHPSWDFSEVRDWHMAVLRLYGDGHFEDIATEKMATSVDETVNALGARLHDANTKLKALQDCKIDNEKKIRALQMQLGRFAKKDRGEEKTNE